MYKVGMHRYLSNYKTLKATFSIVKYHNFICVDLAVNFQLKSFFQFKLACVATYICVNINTATYKTTASLKDNITKACCTRLAL